MTDHSHSNGKPTKHAALEWLRNQPFQDDQDRPGPPIMMNIDESQHGEALTMLATLQELSHIHFKFNKAHSQVRFEDDKTLLYLARKGVRFPHDQTYQNRLKLGKELVQVCGEKMPASERAEKIKALLADKADIHARLGHKKDSALHELMMSKEPDLASAALLLEAHLSPNCVNTDGDTPLHMAAEKLAVAPSFLPMIDLLLQHKANPDLLNNSERLTQESPRSRIEHEIEKRRKNNQDTSRLEIAAKLFDTYHPRSEQSPTGGGQMVR